MKKMKENLNQIIFSLSFLVFNCNCQNPISLLGANISYTYGLSFSRYTLTFPLTSPVSAQNVWVGMGFNSQRAMVLYFY